MASEQEQLYVKLNGYQVVQEDLESVQAIMDNVREAMEVLEQVRHIKKQSLDTIDDNIMRLNSKIEDLDMRMPELEGEKAEPEPSQDLDIDQSESQGPDVEIDDSIKELHSELESLQNELSDITR